MTLQLRIIQSFRCSASRLATLLYVDLMQSLLRLEAEEAA